MNCLHEACTVLADYDGFSVLKCDQLCGKVLIQIDLGNHTVVTLAVDEIARLQKIERAARVAVDSWNLYGSPSMQELGKLASLLDGDK